MVEAKSFSDDLATLQTDISTDLGGILKMVKERNDGKSLRAAKAVSHANEVGPEKPANDSPSERPSRQSRAMQRPRLEESVAVENVTTRLQRDTNEQLTEAALRQKLKKTKPDTRQGIIEIAVQEWLRRSGYPA